LLYRNFGHQSRESAGLDHAFGGSSGDQDGDLQDVPEVIQRFVEKKFEKKALTSFTRNECAGKPMTLRICYFVF